jgi:hypothetical protein
MDWPSGRVLYLISEMCGKKKVANAFPFSRLDATAAAQSLFLVLVQAALRP